MALDQVGNFKKVEVSTGYDAAATSIVLAGGEGAELPDPSGDNYNVVWWDSTNYGDPADDPNVEIVRVTAKATDTLTVTRNQESSGASTKNTGGATYKMIISPTAKMITDIETDIDTNRVVTIDFVVDGGGSAIATGTKGFIEIPFACTLNSWTMVSDVSCTATMDVNRQTYAAYDGSPPSIVGGSSVPTITAAVKGQDLDISDWTSVAIAAGDIVGFDVDSNDSATLITLSLKATRT